MIKKFTLLLVMLLGVVNINAKSTVTTLWDDTYSGKIDIAASSLSAGKTLTIYMSWTGSEGCGLGISAQYTNEDGLLAAGALPSLGETGENPQWIWQGYDTASKSFELSTGDMTKITSSGYLYIASGDAVKMTISKITLTETITPTSISDNLLSENWTASWTAKTFAAQSSAKIGDVIRFSYSAPGGYSYFQFNILDAYGNADAFENKSSNVGTSIETAADLYFEFEITNISDLKKIQNEGFGIKGDNFTLTSVQLLSYADSYDAVSVTIGSDGIATWSSSKKLDFSGKGITPYYASGVVKGTVTLTAISDNTTWDYQGYILKGAPGTYVIPVTETATYPTSTNYLIGTSDHSQDVARSVEGKYHYIFAKDGDNIGFYLLGSDYSETYTEDEVEKTRYAHRLAAHKAYLETETDLSADAQADTQADAQAVSMGSYRYMRLSFGGGEGTTAINTALKNPIVEDGLYYTLQGVAVKNPSKGIYILNGKKVFVK